MLEIKQKLAGVASKKKVLISIVGGIVIVLAAAVWILGRQPVKQKLSISPMQLLPYVSHEQARATICGEADGQLFSDVCQQQYDQVGKNDKEKIDALFSLLKQIENDRSLSDYERYLLGQAVFASLPTKDSLLAHRSRFPAFVTRLGSFTNIAHAQKMVDKGEFQERMVQDLGKVVSDLPRGDNAWVVNVMVSKYSWVSGKRQPIYSEQHGESFDPFPDNPQVNQRDIEYHVRSVVGSLATNQAVFDGPYQGTSDMIAYSFTIMSWNSQAYDGAGEPMSKKHLTSRLNLSEKNYQGENLLSHLLALVKMPSREQPLSQTGEAVPTSWGSPYESETAYEAYFWMHVRDPSRFPNLWVLLANDQEASGKILRDLPLGAPVDLREYFRSAEVQEYYEFLRENTTTTTIPPLDEFLERIDDYQSNLSMPKPPEEPEEEEPPAEGTGGMSPEEAEYRRWLDSI